MKTIALTELHVPDNRQRREFNEKQLDELALSIREIGLLQPIVLRNDGRTLLAGERRTRAIQRLYSQNPHLTFNHDGTTVPNGHIPYVLASDLSASQLYQAELEENIRRSDLTWQERVRSIAELHKLRGTQAAERGQVQTFKDTASEIRGEEAEGIQITEVSNAVILADFLDDPFVSAAKDEKEARKILKEEMKDRERRKRAEEYDATAIEHKLYNSSCFDIGPEFNSFFDCIVTDPPYGIDIHKKEMFDVHTHDYDDSDEAFQEICSRLPSLMYRIAKDDAHAYVFCDIRRFNDLFVAFELGGWTVWPRPLIWDKGNTGSFGNIEYGFRACYDAVLFCRKGDRKVTAGYRDVINITQPTNLPHPAGKPPILFADLIKRSCLPGDRVADLFAGSGPIFPAAVDQKVIAFGWEISPKYHAIALESLEKCKS
jgi:ParB-like chromosome segregation protein Spo0J/DNA modification methylase